MEDFEEMEEMESAAETEDTAEEEHADGTAENPEEEQNAEGTAEKPEQTEEERARWADLDRKRQLEAQREANAELLEALAEAGVPAVNTKEAVFAVRQMAEQARLAEQQQEQYDAEEQMQQQAEESGIPLEVLMARAEAEQARRETEAVKETVKNERAATIFAADKAVVSTADPKFFETATTMQLKAFGAMRVSGIDALTALAMVKGAPAEKKGHGTGHMVPARGGASDGVDVPAAVLRDYAEMGYTKEQATRDYKRQLKKRS